VPLHDGVPPAAMRTPKQIANSEWLLHFRSMCKLRDNAGQPVRIPQGHTREFRLILVGTRRQDLFDGRSHGDG
jgi:hypothetical protein